jgi:hypothetical protein
VILYVSETWALKKSDGNKFLILERKILRKIFGPIKYDITGEWKRRKNIELQYIFNKNNIAETIKKRRLRWAGHAMQSQNSTKNGVGIESSRKNALGKTIIEMGRYN